MSKEFSEKKKTNPLVYILGIPVGFAIIAFTVMAIYSFWKWESQRDYRECIRHENYIETIGYKRTSNCLEYLK
jgi:hypothetical protein